MFPWSDSSPSELSSDTDSGFRQITLGKTLYFFQQVFIASLIAQEANVLVLDEPTNNLYPLTAQALSKFLSAFPGSIIAVSHDRAFTERIADRVVYFSREDGLST